MSPSVIRARYNFFKEPTTLISMQVKGATLLLISRAIVYYRGHFF